MPHRRWLFAHGHAEQGFDQLEQALQHTRLGEVLLHLLAAERIARLLQLFGGIGTVPGLQVRQVEALGGKEAQFSQFAVGIGAGTAGQVAHEVQHLLGAARHLGHQRLLGVIAVTQHGRFLSAQGQQFLHQRAVVQSGGAEFAGAGGVGAVDGLAQRAVAGELHQRQPTWRLQAQPVAGLPCGLCSGAGGLPHIGRHTGQLLFVDQQAPGVGRVQHVVAELLRQRTHAVLHGSVAFAGRALQLGAAQNEIAQRMAQGLVLRGRQRLRAGGFQLGSDGFVLSVQPRVGAQAGAEVDDAGQVGSVRCAQRGRVGHALQMADVAPHAHQPFDGHVQRQRQRLVVGRHRVADGPLQCRFGVGQQSIDGRRDVLRLDGREIGCSAVL